MAQQQLQSHHKRRTMTNVTAAAVEEERNDDNPLPVPPHSSSLKTTKSSSSSIMSSSTILTCRPPKMSVIIVVIAFIFLLPVVYVGQSAISGKNIGGSNGGFGGFGIVKNPANDPPGILPLDLLSSQSESGGGGDSAVYTEGDFQNAAGIAPTFWNCSLDGNCDSNEIWGPCYAPHGIVHWKQEVEKHQQDDIMTPSSSGAMPPIHFYNHGEQQRISGGGGWNSHSQQPPADPNDMANTCRPGFLIIGAGKCGTRYVMFGI